MTVPSKWLCGVLLILSLLWYQAAHAQARIKADVHCQPTIEPLQYDCEIRLWDARTNGPLSGIGLSIGADMPSMPGMHQATPVKAAEDPVGATYRARLVLEMHGDWALHLNISGPVRDRLVKTLRFEPDRVGERSHSEMGTRRRY